VKGQGVLGEGPHCKRNKQPGAGTLSCEGCFGIHGHSGKGLFFGRCEEEQLLTGFISGEEGLCSATDLSEDRDRAGLYCQGLCPWSLGLVSGG
jgi:hypothetical protein